MRVLLAVCLSLALTASCVWAHKVRVFAWAEGDTIHGEAAFSGGRVAQAAEVDVQNAADDSLLLTVTTAEDGTFAFPVPEAARAKRLDLRLVLRAGTGHQGEWLLAATDYLPGDTAAPTVPPAPASVIISDKPDAVVESLAPAALQQLVEQAVARQIAPLQRQLAELKERGTQPRDIIGGIGYLVGLAGVIAWSRSRKRG